MEILSLAVRKYALQYEAKREENNRRLRILEFPQIQEGLGG
jgi:hypothetical protein